MFNRVSFFRVFAMTALAFWLLFSPAPASAADNFCYGSTVARPDGTVTNPCYESKCYREVNGQGEVIKWVKSERECRYRSVGQSWGHPGHYTNFDRFRLP